MAKTFLAFPRQFLRFLRDLAITTGNSYREQGGSPPAELEKAILVLQAFIDQKATMVEPDENEQLMKIVSYVVWSIKHMGGTFSAAGEDVHVWASDDISERVLDMLGIDYPRD